MCYATTHQVDIVRVAVGALQGGVARTAEGSKELGRQQRTPAAGSAALLPRAPRLTRSSASGTRTCRRFRLPRSAIGAARRPPARSPPVRWPPLRTASPALINYEQPFLLREQARQRLLKLEPVHSKSSWPFGRCTCALEALASITRRPQAVCKRAEPGRGTGSAQEGNQDDQCPASPAPSLLKRAPGPRHQTTCRTAGGRAFSHRRKSRLSWRDELFPRAGTLPQRVPSIVCTHSVSQPVVQARQGTLSAGQGSGASAGPLTPAPAPQAALAPAHQGICRLQPACPAPACPLHSPSTASPHPRQPGCRRAMASFTSSSPGKRKELDVMKLMSELGPPAPGSGREAGRSSRPRAARPLC